MTGRPIWFVGIMGGASVVASFAPWHREGLIWPWRCPLAGRIYFTPSPYVSRGTGPRRTAGSALANASITGDSFVEGKSCFLTPDISIPRQCNPREIVMTLKRIDSLQESH